MKTLFALLIFTIGLNACDSASDDKLVKDQAQLLSHLDNVEMGVYHQFVGYSSFLEEVTVKTSNTTGEWLFYNYMNPDNGKYQLAMFFDEEPSQNFFYSYGDKGTFVESHLNKNCLEPIQMHRVLLEKGTTSWKNHQQSFVLVRGASTKIISIYDSENKNNMSLDVDYLFRYVRKCYL